MFSTEEQRAEHYILSGYFPLSYDYINISHLRDIFNNLSKEFKTEMLKQEATRENADKLFRLIYSSVVVDDLISEIN